MLNQGSNYQPAGAGNAFGSQLQKERPERPPVTSMAQDLFARVGTLNSRLDRISQAIKSCPRAAADKIGNVPVDLHSNLDVIHDGMNYTDSLIAEIERSLGI